MAKFSWRERFGNGVPVDLQPSTNGRLLNPRLFFPLREGQGLAGMCDEMVVSAIVLLRFLSRPSTITRFIVAVILSAVNGVLRSWPLAHVGKKIFKRVKPAFANRDTASAVVLEAVVLRAGTTANHAVPALVSAARCGSAGMAVFEVPGGCPVAQEAPTTLGAARDEVDAQCHDDVATIADALPLRVAVGIRPHRASNEQSFKPLTYHINEFGHNQSIREGRDVVNGGYFG